MTAPRVSIVIPMRDAARTIDATLDSVMLQANVTLETIIVDDRSSDDGPARARAHAVGAQVVACEGVGRSAARNTGFRIAHGDALVFLDADDLLHKHALAARLAALDGAGPGVIIVSSYAERLGGSLRERSAFADLPATGDARLALLRRNQLAIHCATLRRDELAAWAGNTPFPEHLDALEDWDLWLRLSFAGARFVLHDRVDCDYVLRDAMTNTVPSAATDQLAVIDRAAALVHGSHEGERFRQQAARALHAARFEAHLWRAALWRRAGRPLSALADLGRAAAQGPSAALELPSIARARRAEKRWRAGAVRHGR